MTNTNNMTRYGASRPACPLCGATEGQRCITASGAQVKSWSHKVRDTVEAEYAELEAEHYQRELDRVEVAATVERERIAALDARYALSMPAHEGETVTQGHADYCARNGHATNKQTASHCFRCGAVQTVEATITKVVSDGSTANGAVIWDSVEVEVRGGNSHQQTMAAHDALDDAQDKYNVVACVAQYSTELDANTGVMTFRFI